MGIRLYVCSYDFEVRGDFLNADSELDVGLFVKSSKKSRPFFESEENDLRSIFFVQTSRKMTEDENSKRDAAYFGY